jgi:hypothetical protein
MEALGLVGLAAWCFAVAVGGGLVGLVLGNLRLPVMVSLASSASAGAGANIATSGVAALVAGVVHVRAGRVDWRLVRWMTPPSMAFAFAGGYASGIIPEAALLGTIAAVLLWSGVDLLRNRNVPPRPGELGLNLKAAVVSSAVIGLLGGTVGLILGALRMPALLRRVGAEPHGAVGTNLIVGVGVGIAGLLGHLPGDAPDWRLFVVGAAASIPGAVLGARLTGRLDRRQLVTAIGVLLLVAAAGMVASAVA